MKRRVGWCQCYRQEKLRRQRRRFSQVNYRKFLERKYIHSRDVCIGLNIGAVVFFFFKSIKPFSITVFLINKF